MEPWRYDNPRRLAGIHRTLAFPFAYDSPGLAGGYEVYTPTIGDILHDAWIEVDTAWDGTTPLGDVGSFTGGNIFGWFGVIFNGVDMTVADSPNAVTDYSLLAQQGGNFSSLLSKNAEQNLASTHMRVVPSRFVTADPLKVIVTQNGEIGGAAPGATKGSAILYLIVSTPARG